MVMASDRDPSIFKSPGGMAMVAVGVALAILGPYLLYKLGPLGRNKVKDADETSQPAPPSIDGSLDIADLDSLPQDLHDGAIVLLTTENPVPPDPIASLPEPMGEDVLRPVSEAEAQNPPTLYWSPGFAEPPYSVTVLQGTQVVARGQGLANTSWTPPVALMKGAV